MIIVTCYDVTESDFKREMKEKCPSSFSDAGLALIYAHLKQREKEEGEIRFTPAQVNLEYEEWSYLDYLEEYNIDIRKLAFDASDLNDLSPYEQAIKDHLDSDFVGFTPEETVVSLTP